MAESEIGGWRHRHLGDVGSTNAEALSLAREGDPGRLWLTADRQLAGRGRSGRSWVSVPGNLYASLLLLDPAPMSRLGTLPLMVATGVHRTLERVLAGTGHRVEIKWPNDILVDGAKICGILVETAPVGQGLAVVIGCGINCGHHPADTLYPTTDLAALGAGLAPEALFPILVEGMEEALIEWKRGEGFATIRAYWRAAARGLGAPIEVDTGGGRLAGLFEDIDEDGYLVLKVEGVRRRISAGDLFFRLPAN